MSDETSQRLIRELAADLQPVAVVPRLRVLLTGVLVLWAAVLSLAMMAAGPRGDLSEIISGNEAYSGVVLGLLLAGVGGTLAALAAVIPGRESVRLGALALAVSGVTVAGFLCLSSPTGNASVDPMADLACIGNASVLAVPMLGWIGFRVLRGWLQDPLRVAVISIFGSVAMGALIVHLICPAGASSHFVAAHLGAAPLVALLGSFPLAFFLRRVMN